MTNMNDIPSEIKGQALFEEFQGILGFVQTAFQQGRTAHEVETGLWERIRKLVPDRKLRFYRDVYSPAPGNPGGFNSFLDNRRRVTGMNEIRSHSWRLIGALILGRAEPSPCGCG